MDYPTLSRTIEGFLLHISAAGRSHNTIRNYRMDLNRFSNWLNDLRIDAVESKHIEEFLSYMKNDYRITHVGIRKIITPRSLSKKSLHNIHGCLAVFWKWASAEFQLPNPFKVPHIKYYPKPIAPLTEKEVEALLVACKSIKKQPEHRKGYSSTRTTYKRDKAIILTLLDTGMRVSELCDLKVKDYTQESSRLMVTGKGSKTRFVYLGKVSSQSLWSYLLERFPSHQPDPEDPLFAERLGIHSLTRTNVLNLIKRLGVKAEVKDVYPHKFRHTFAVQFLRNGGNVFELQQLLGHSDITMVRRYVQLAQIDLERSAKRASPADRWRLR